MNKSNPVTEAVEALGGTLEDVAVVARVSRQGVWEWQKLGRIRDSRCAVLVAEECARRGHPEITVARLAGLEDEQKPSKGRRGRGGPLSGTKGDEQAATGLPMEAA